MNYDIATIMVVKCNIQIQYNNALDGELRYTTTHRLTCIMHMVIMANIDHTLAIQSEDNVIKIAI